MLKATGGSASRPQGSEEGTDEEDDDDSSDDSDDDDLIDIFLTGLQERKKKGKCKDCDEIGHWAGDPECKLVQSGKKPAFVARARDRSQSRGRSKSKDR